MNFEDIMALLADSHAPLTAQSVHGLSALSKENQAKLAAIWPTLPVERRRALIQHLNAVSEANFEMDFNAVDQLALSDSDSDVRRYAIEGLWEDESPALLHRLLDMALHDEDVIVRGEAIREVGRFILLGEYEELSPEDARLAQGTILKIYDAEDDDEIRRSVLEAISNSSHPNVREMILEFYQHTNSQMRQSAIFAMGRTCDSDWGPQIMRELASEDEMLRYEAIRAAGHMELRDAVPRLGEIIRDSDDIEIIEIAIWALGEIGGEQARKILHRAISWAEAQGNSEIVEAAEEALDAASLPGDFLMFDMEP